MSQAGISITVPGEPIPKPRMVRGDKWKKRECVLNYREWKDKVVKATKPWREEVLAAEIVQVRFYLPIPASYSPAKRLQLAGTPHRLTPDADNLGKGLMDALLSKDQGVWDQRFTKYWDDGQGPRTVVQIA